MLCGRGGGAMKCSEDGCWVHIPCVTWNPLLQFANIETLRPPAIRPVLQAAEKHTCMLCGSAAGMTVKCAEPLCGNFFHVTCAQNQGFLLDARDDADGGLVFTITCNNHSIPVQNSGGLQLDEAWEEGLDVDWDEVDALEAE